MRFFLFSLLLHSITWPPDSTRPSGLLFILAADPLWWPFVWALLIQEHVDPAVAAGLQGSLHGPAGHHQGEPARRGHLHLPGKITEHGDTALTVIHGLAVWWGVRGCFGRTRDCFGRGKICFGLKATKMVTFREELRKANLFLQIHFSTINSKFYNNKSSHIAQ